MRKNNEFLIDLLNRMEDKMVELMGEEAYYVWATLTARDMFRQSVENMEDVEFKYFVQANSEQITK